MRTLLVIDATTGQNGLQLSLMAGNDVVTALTQIMREMLGAYSGFGDMVLTVMMQLGILAAPEGAEPGHAAAPDL